MINVGVFGYGTVGSGVVEVLSKNAEVIEKHVHDKVNVKAILDLRDFPGDEFESLITHDVDTIISDPEISVICETMGGIGAAYKFTKAALSAGKSVCSSNKELVAAYGPELISLAKKNNCSYKFEASVGGGIPIIRPLMDAVTADKIESVTGIVNGTTNYMLTKMAEEGAEFDDVLKEAQAKGYAEANPDADILGLDAMRKLAILSSLVYGKTVKTDSIYTEGITNISARDFKYAGKLNKSIKLLAKYVDAPEGAYAMVSPFMLSETNPLYSVRGVFNAIMVHGNMLDDAMFFGRGAGKLPTASAVCGDVVECAKNIGKHLPCDWADEVVELNGRNASKRAFFVRVKASDKDKALNLFGKVEAVDAGFSDEFSFVTEKMSEEAFEKKASEIEIINRIRMDK